MCFVSEWLEISIFCAILLELICKSCFWKQLLCFGLSRNVLTINGIRGCKGGQVRRRWEVVVRMQDKIVQSQANQYASMFYLLASTAVEFSNASSVNCLPRFCPDSMNWWLWCNESKDLAWAYLISTHSMIRHNTGLEAAIFAAANDHKFNQFQKLAGRKPGVFFTVNVVFAINILRFNKRK